MSVRKSLAWSYGSQVFVVVVTFGSSIVVARILGPYEMGVFAIAMATAGLLSILSQFGVGTYLLQHETVDPQTKRTLFTVNAIINLIISFGMLVTAVVGPRFGVNDAVGNVLALIALSPLIAIFDFLPSSLLTRDMQYRTLSLITMGRVIVTSGTVVGFAVAGFGSVSPAFAIVAAATYGAIATNIAGRQHVSFGLSLKGWREVVRFGTHLMTIGGVTTVAQKVCEIALGHVLGLAALGVFSRASSLADQILNNVYSQATRVIFTKMAEEKRERGTVSETFLGGISMITAVMWPLVIGVAVVAGPLVHLLYGERWMEAAVPLSILMFGHFFGLAYGMSWELCILNKRTGWQARVEVVKAVVGSVAFALGSFLGLAGAAGGRVVEGLTGLVIYGPKMREMGGAAEGQLSRIFGTNAVLTLGATAPAAVVMAAAGWSPLVSWWSLGPAVGLGIGIWLLMLRRMRHALMDEIVLIVGRLRLRLRPA